VRKHARGLDLADDEDRPAAEFNDPDEDLGVHEDVRSQRIGDA
jgi:hypothetical protein